MSTGLSYSSMKTLQSCEQKYHHYKVAETPKDADYEESDALGVGKAFHEVLEKTKHNQCPQELIKEAMENHGVDGGEYGMLLAMLSTYIDLHQASDLEVIHCELGIENPEFIGYIDAIAKDKAGNWWIIDLKTAAKFDTSILPRLPKDMQLNLYAYFKEGIANQFQLDPNKFKGCRYRVTTKTTKVQKAGESSVAYARRVVQEGSVRSMDIEIPVESMNPKYAYSIFKEVSQRSKELKDGEAPRKNYNACLEYFKPCQYFSQCHGHLFTKGSDKVKVHTVESFSASEVL